MKKADIKQKKAKMKICKNDKVSKKEEKHFQHFIGKVVSKTNFPQRPGTSPIGKIVSKKVFNNKNEQNYR